MNIKNNINNLRQHIPSGCKLIAVSKTNPIEKIKEAYEAGQRMFGENRVQELVPKFDALPKDIEWHMIGHMQTNKVKYIAPFIHLIHSVDSFNVLEEINKQGSKIDRTISCLLQIHIAEEESKFGFSENEVLELLRSDALKKLNHVQIFGLMGMATFTDNLEQVRREFRSLKTFFEKLKNSPLPAKVKMQELSMGMSGDYKIAIEEGSTMVRVGSAIFGERN
ncbi:YggS family pyridoxal phosphate-dependent enzyme [Chryseolinea sp. H1M3-3]|uniref:YggS family pyridoxal phosphate-dependent enzyme n=1 Tax=Chryseolinea sp. H1M3-3 TaxID=3034144 RepID=UPI0023EC4E7E|nr:YggS family pyridoxal phosphate-dependent enzyme [Chryseolinea sp. H1M3-3]